MGLWRRFRRRLNYWQWLLDEKAFWLQRVTLGREFKKRIYAGLPGSGKTLAGVRDCLHLMRQGVTVYSNVRIVDRVQGHRSKPVASWLDILRVVVYQVSIREPAMIFIDEIHEIADARNWQNTPGFVKMVIRQRRHFGVGLMASTQALDQVEKAIRTLVDEVVEIGRWCPAIPRHAVYSLRYVDCRAVDRGEDGAFGDRSLTWINADAYVSYSTCQLVGSDDLAYMKDDEIANEVKALSDELREHLQPEEMFVFDHDPVADLEAASEPLRVA